MGLISTGIYGWPRQGILAGVITHCMPAYRPRQSSVSFRRTFGSDIVSFPVGYFGNAITLPMKYGGVSCVIRGSGGISVSAEAKANGSVTISGTGSITPSANKGVNGTVTVNGSGTVSGAIAAKANGSVTIRIGASPSATDIAYSVWGLVNGIESGWTPQQTMRAMAAILAGKVSGAESNAPVFRSITDSKDRVSSTTDANGNRTSVTLDPN